MTAPLTGYSATLPTDVLLDSGVLYVGASIFATLAGGLKFDQGIAYRNVEFDGKRSAVKGLDRKTTFAPKLTGTMIELAATTVPKIDAGASVTATGAWTGSTSYLPKKAGTLLVAGDYLTDVRAIWLRGSGTYVQVRFPSALITKYDVTSQDANEIAIAMEIEARLDLSVTGSTTGDAPYRIEYIATV